MKNNINNFTIFAARSEYRSSSRMKDDLPASKVTQSNELEGLTGADLMLTCHPKPAPDTAQNVNIQIAMGARLVQAKYSTDITSSVEDQRLQRSINKMKSTGATNPQCILLFVGIYKKDRDGIFSIDRFKIGRKTQFTLAAMYGIINAWFDHGGCFHHISYGNQLQDWIASQARAMVKPPMVNLYDTKGRLTEAMADPDHNPNIIATHLRGETIIKDIRTTIYNIPSVGPIKAGQFYTEIVNIHGDCNIRTIADYFASDDPLALSGVGKKSLANIRDYLGL